MKPFAGKYVKFANRIDTNNDPVNYVDSSGESARAVVTLGSFGLKAYKYRKFGLRGIGKAGKEIWKEIKQDAGAATSGNTSVLTKAAGLSNLLLGTWFNTDEAGTENSDTNADALPADTAGSPPGGPDDGDGHDEERHAQGRQGDSNRDIGDANRVVREGRQFTDTEAGHTVFANGNRVRIVDRNGKPVTCFKNTRKNTQQRIRDGRWKPVE